MKKISVCLLACTLLHAHHARADAANNKEWGDYDQIERDQARAEARTKRFSSFRVCADPGNMPLSDQAGEGLENKLADLVSHALGTTVTYFWRPYLERGVTRQTFDENVCDVFMDVPAGYGVMLTTEAIYRSTYVLATRTDRHLDFTGLSDPRLKQLSVGVYELSALRQALAEHGVVSNVKIHEVSYDGDLVPSHQPWSQVQEMIDGKIDVAGAWGPLAGWLRARGAPITLQPTNRMDDQIPMEFDIAIGMRKTDVTLKYAIENVLETHKAEVQALLERFGVPLVTCGECVISGTLPAHGLYTAPVETAAEEQARLHAPPAVSQARLTEWLAEGADLNQELGNAVIGSDPARVAFLLDRNADPNKPALDGTLPLADAAKAGNLVVARLLLDHGAHADARDEDGWTALLYAAVNNQADMVRLLAARGASADAATEDGFTPLSLATEEGKYDAALALLDVHAKPDSRNGTDNVTALMVVASQRPTDNRAEQLTQYGNPVAVARALIAHGADPNAANSEGVTPLMIAAARDNPAIMGVLIQAGARIDKTSSEGRTARDIAAQNGNQAALRTLDLFAPARAATN